LCCRTFVGLVYTKACLVAGATTEFLWTKKYTSDWAFSLISFFFHRRRRERERERERVTPGLRTSSFLAAGETMKPNGFFLFFSLFYLKKNIIF
jgi:uncharacterized membrane protein YdjX (TVP38/TMEM64 family)